jgi:nucleotide-binding universal stress UspA family protein
VIKTRDASAVRRIAVTLDALDLSIVALDQAARLARHMGAQLEGIFVEDIDLLQLAELPFLREVRRSSRSVETMNPARMEQELRVLARRAERLLGEQAARHHVSWSFRIWRGSIDSDLLAAAMEVDVLALTRLGSVLAVSPARRIGHSAIAVLYGGGDTAARALDTAASLATEQQHARLNILLPAAQGMDAAVLQQEATLRLGEYAVEAQFIQMPDASLPALLEALAGTGNAALILQRDHELLQTPTLRHCLNSLNCPVLVVR